MSRLWMRLALFINAITPVHFLICAAVYAIALQYVGLDEQVPIFIGTLCVTLGIVAFIKLTYPVPRRKDALVHLGNNRAFPSGHAASSALVSIIVPYTLAQTLSLATVGILAALFAFGAVVVAASRLTLRVHTATQVVVGLVLGVLLPLACIYFLNPIVLSLFKIF